VEIVLTAIQLHAEPGTILTRRFEQRRPHFGWLGAPVGSGDRVRRCLSEDPAPRAYSAVPKVSWNVGWRNRGDFYQRRGNLSSFIFYGLASVHGYFVPLMDALIFALKSIRDQADWSSERSTTETRKVPCLEVQRLWARKAFYSSRAGPSGWPMPENVAEEPLIRSNGLDLSTGSKRSAHDW